MPVGSITAPYPKLPRTPDSQCLAVLAVESLTQGLGAEAQQLSQASSRVTESGFVVRHQVPEPRTSTLRQSRLPPGQLCGVASLCALPALEPFRS